MESGPAVLDSSCKTRAEESLCFWVALLGSRTVPSSRSAFSLFGSAESKSQREFSAFCRFPWANSVSALASTDFLTAGSSGEFAGYNPHTNELTLASSRQVATEALQA
jgi:hypothetical protein